MFCLQRVRITLLSSLAAVTLLVTSLGAATVSASQATTSSPAGASSVTAAAFCDPGASFGRNNFPKAPKIDNHWFPLVPGMRFTLEGRANRGGGLLPHRVVFTVTDLIKVIDGVPSVVVWDRDFNEDQIVEAELAFFAQDKDGNVWNLGEYPEEYEDGQFTGAPSTWIAGRAGAEAGIHMLANPQLGTGYYLQGSAPEIDFLDCAKVFKTGEQTCVPVDCYQGVLVTDEVSPLDQGGGSQRKYHAPEVGIVQVGAVADPEGETLVLVERGCLNSHELVVASKEALKLDRHGYQVSDVYSKTLPAKRTLQACQ